jgi:hypothetical protein
MQLPFVVNQTCKKLLLWFCSIKIILNSAIEAFACRNVIIQRNLTLVILPKQITG